MSATRTYLQNPECDLLDVRPGCDFRCLNELPIRQSRRMGNTREEAAELRQLVIYCTTSCTLVVCDTL
jgi:hypothetical protein